MDYGWHDRGYGGLYMQNGELHTTGSAPDLGLGATGRTS